MIVAISKFVISSVSWTVSCAALIPQKSVSSRCVNRGIVVVTCVRVSVKWRLQRGANEEILRRPSRQNQTHSFLTFLSYLISLFFSLFVTYFFPLLLFFIFLTFRSTIFYSLLFLSSIRGTLARSFIAVPFFVIN